MVRGASLARCCRTNFSPIGKSLEEVRRVALLRGPGKHDGGLHVRGAGNSTSKGHSDRLVSTKMKKMISEGLDQ